MTGLATGRYRYTQLPDARTIRGGPSMVYYEGFIFLIGGVKLKSVEKFNTQDSNWTMAPSMNEKRHSHCSCVL